MFSKEQILGAYRKLKSYVYYNKNLTYLVKTIAEFEHDTISFNKKIQKLYISLEKEDLSYFLSLINEISVFPMPKKICDDISKEQNVFDNEIPSSRVVKIDEVNYFINCPIELFIFDVLWTLCVLASLKNSGFFPHCYANIPAYDLINKNKIKILDRINFKSLSLFQPYYWNYIKWQKDIINLAKEEKKMNKDTTLISLDITKFFYSSNIVISDFFETLQKENEEIANFKFLFTIQNYVYKTYAMVIKKYRKSCSNNPIPIGFASSCILSNFYLSTFDENINSSDKAVIKESRYVDDILILLKGYHKKDFRDFALSELSTFFTEKESNTFVISNTNLVVKNCKTRVFAMKHSGTNRLLNKLENDLKKPSCVDLFPKYVSNFGELLEKSSCEEKTLKLRENIGNIDFDIKKMTSYLRGFSLMNKGVDQSDLNNEEKENKKLCLGMLNSKNLISVFSNWNILYEFLIANPKTRKSDFKYISSQISSTINKIKYIGEDSNKKIIQNMLKSSLITLNTIAVSQALCIDFSKKLKESDYQKEVVGLALALRKANLFNHSLVECPLGNFFKNPPENMRDDSFKNIKNFDLDIYKIKLSPRFIHLDEYLNYCQIKDIFNNTKINNPCKYVDEYNKKILPFYSFKNETLEIAVKEKDGFILNEVSFDRGKKIDVSSISIALANINLSNYFLTSGHKNKDRFLFPKPQISNKNTLINILNYLSKKKEDYDFLVFPEYFLPIQWTYLLARFSKLNKVNVITGIQPIELNGRELNLQAVMVPYIDKSNHKKALLFYREKNFYPPLEKQMANNTHGLKCVDPEKPMYYLFNNHSYTFSSFICYELTDVSSRSLFKNKTDILVSSEYNFDISYFSNIVESAARDLSSFIVQVNSSEYGDTRIVAPFRDKEKTIANIGGGIFDFVHVATINLDEYKKYLCEFEICDKKSNYSTLDKKDEFKKIKKPSARTHK